MLIVQNHAIGVQGSRPRTRTALFFEARKSVEPIAKTTLVRLTLVLLTDCRLSGRRQPGT